MSVQQQPAGLTAPGARDQRWLGVGVSADPDPETAGGAAAAAAVAGRGDCRLAVVFASPEYELARLLRGAQSVLGDTPVIGCSTAGEVATTGPSTGSVVITVLGGPGFRVATSVAADASRDLRGAGARVAESAVGLPGEHKVLLLLTDGLNGDQEEVVRGAVGVLGAAVPLVGGCAGDDLAMKQTFVMHGTNAVSDAVVAAAISSDAPIGIGVNHGWRTVGEPMLVTASSGTRVTGLDDRPALDVYLDRLGVGHLDGDPSAFTHFAQTHPLGLSRRSGAEVRFVAGADFDDRSLACIASVPPGALVWIMEGDSQSILDATDAACQAALGQLGGRPALGLLAFDCIARRGVLGDAGIRREVERISAVAGAAPVAGFYTYGEIARTRGTGGFHNQTLVVLALA